MKKNYFVLLFALLFVSTNFAQNLTAKEIIVVNGESFGANASNIGAYDIESKTYTVFDTLHTSSVQDIFIEDSLAFVAAQSKLFVYDLINKTKIAEVAYPGVSPNKGSLFTDENRLYVGNWFGQIDSNLYAFDKSTLAFEYAVTEASQECGGGLSLNDTLYVGQKLKGTIDACSPFGCYEDTMGSILISDANTGAYVRTIELDTAGAGISQIYNYGNFLYAVCPSANNIIKIEIASDSIYQVFSLDPFSQSVAYQDEKIYLDLNNQVGYFDMATETSSTTGLALEGVALAYDPLAEISVSTLTDFSSFGKLKLLSTSSEDSVDVGVSPEAIGIFYTKKTTTVVNNAPIAETDEYEFNYDENTSEYLLDVLANDSDLDGDVLSISNISASQIPGTILSVIGNKINYKRAAGIANSDSFTYSACDDAGECSMATVTVTIKSTTAIDAISKEPDFVVYPNPSFGEIKIKTKSEINRIELIDLSGKIVKITKETSLNLRNLNKGIYFVKVINKQGFAYSTKFILK